jgi:hypothetical protein
MLVVYGMDAKIVIITLGTWFVFMFLAIVNAVLREGIFSSFLTELRAHQLSTFTLMAIFFVVTYFVLYFSGITLTDQQALIMGLVWFVLTICFEFLAGHFVFGNPWDKLFADYNVLQGRIWILVPLTTLFAPFLVKKLMEA